MFVTVGKVQFAVDHLKDKSLKDAQLMFEHLNPLLVKKAFDMVNKTSKKQTTKK